MSVILKEHPPAVLVMFGATGDLAKRKLFPALFSLFRDGNLSHRFAVVGVARREFSPDAFRDYVRRSVKEFARYPNDDPEEWTRFAEHLYYYSLNIHDRAGYAGLKRLLEEIEHRFDIPGNRVFYLAVAPQFFATLTVHLKGEGLTENRGWKRLVIEKPFGHDLKSAEALNGQIREVFQEEEIYRIDHYLGKEMVQNIEVIRFANSLFEPVWNNRHIANIQITSSETVGVEERGAYYEKSGALRDMVQNHMLQMVMMMAMEPPSRLKMEAIRDEKVKVLRSLRRYKPEEVSQYVVRGQYGAGKIGQQQVNGYREEPNVDPQSKTETFVAAKLMIDNFRWAGVPFYIRTGKRMRVKSTEIIVQFKDVPTNLYFNQAGDLHPNLLIIHIQPDEGVTLQLNVKKSGTGFGIMPVAMDFCKNCQVGINSPEAYERLLFDCLHGDSTNFTRWDEVALSWKFVDPISTAWTAEEPDFPNYAAGTMGPAAANALLARDGFHWWPITDIEKNYQQAAEVKIRG
ncbi:glucose-6-phosphate dehydrogenase [Bacillaceae bacterium]